MNAEPEKALLPLIDLLSGKETDDDFDSKSVLAPTQLPLNAISVSHSRGVQGGDGEDTAAAAEDAAKMHSSLSHWFINEETPRGGDDASDNVGRVYGDVLEESRKGTVKDAHDNDAAGDAVSLDDAADVAFDKVIDVPPSIVPAKTADRLFGRPKESPSLEGPPVDHPTHKGGGEVIEPNPSQSDAEEVHLAIVSPKEIVDINEALNDAADDDHLNPNEEGIDEGEKSDEEFGDNAMTADCIGGSGQKKDFNNNRVDFAEKYPGEFGCDEDVNDLNDKLRDRLHVFCISIKFSKCISQ